MKFLRWWLIFITSLAGTMFLYTSGLLEYILKVDGSYMCISILFTYFISSIYIGNLSNKDLSKNTLDFLYYIAEVLMAMGMAGTILGYIFLLPGFANPITDNTAIQGLLTQTGNSLATALYTTIFGLTASNLLKAQLINLEK